MIPTLCECATTPKQTWRTLCAAGGSSYTPPLKPTNHTLHTPRPQLSPSTAPFWSRQHMVPPPQKHDAPAKAAFLAPAILPIHSVKECPLSDCVSFASTGLRRSTGSLGCSGDNRDGSCMARPGLCLVHGRLFPGQVVGAERIVWAKRADNSWKMSSFIV